MKNLTKALFLLLMVTVFTFVGSVTFAKGRDRHDAMLYFYLKKSDYQLEQAIQQLAQEDKGKVIAAEVEVDDETVLYELIRIENDVAMEIVIDPKTQKVVQSSKDGIFSKYSSADTRKAALEGKISLIEAIEIARKQVDGLITRADFSRRNLVSSYRIHIVTNEGSRMILVDAESGEYYVYEKQEKGRKGKHPRGKHGRD